MQDVSATFDDPRFEVVEFIDRNHVQMTKFSGRGDLEYVKFKNALKRLVKFATEDQEHVIAGRQPSM